MRWTLRVKLSSINVSDLLVHDHHLVEGTTILGLGKLSSNKLHSIKFSETSCF